MRTSRFLSFVAVALLALPGLASANCYSIYDVKNQLAFQSTVAPIDLSGRISSAMSVHFPGGYLVVTPDEADCREFRTGATTSPRFDAKNTSQAAPHEVLEAPILRGAPAPVTGDVGSATQETVRSGTNLKVRRP